MKKRFDKKYFIALAMFLFMAGRASAQNLSEKREKSEKITEIKSNDNDIDKSLTLTHTMPIDNRRTKLLAQNPKIKISNVEDALYTELWTFANTTGADTKLVFAPLVVLKPFVRIKDKLTVGFTTTQMVQNYTEKSMTSMIHDMYAHATLKTSDCDLYVKVGNFSVLNYSADFAKYMPVSTFFLNAINLQSGAYFPRAIVVGEYDNNQSLALGYMENGSGFKFDGNDGYAICMMEVKGDWAKLGGLIKTNAKHTVGNIHFSCALTKKDEVLLQFLNIGMGEQFAIHGTYGHKFKDDKATLSVNGFYQTKQGVAGGNINLRHSSSGAYASVGATYHDPLREFLPDGTHNEKYDKFTPFVEFGIIKSLYPIKTR